MHFFIHQISWFRKSSLGILVFGILSGAVVAQERTVHVNLVPNASSADATEWRFTTDDPGENWFATTFEDGAWLHGKGGFGAGLVQGGSIIGQDWTTSDIWLRKSFDLATLDFESLILNLQHDDDVEVYLNGTLVLSETFTGGFPAEAYLPSEAKAALKVGTNSLALHCSNSGGGPQYIDAGLSVTRTMQATTLVDDARFYGADWKWTDIQPEAGWNDTGFADDTWTAAHSGFGTDEFATYRATNWTGYEIWLRKKFTVGSAYSDFLLTYLHDDDVQVYINGVSLLQESGSHTDYKEASFTAAKVGAVVGENIIAIHCTNTGGGPQFIDAGLIGLKALTAPTGLQRTMRDRSTSQKSHSRVLRLEGDTILRGYGFEITRGSKVITFGLDGAWHVTRPF